MADALDSGSSAARLPGSSPGFRITSAECGVVSAEKEKLSTHYSGLTTKNVDQFTKLPS